MDRRIDRSGVEQQPSVVITGADRPTGLTTGRALMGLPIRLIGVVNNRETDCASSRCWHQLIMMEKRDAASQLDALVAAARQGHIPPFSLLLFSQDDFVIAASQRLAELRQWFIVPLPDQETVDLLMDKTLFHRWAVDHDIPVPESAIVASVEETLESSKAMSFPCILKPLCRTAAWERAHPNIKLFYFADHAALQKALSEQELFSVMDRFLLQEWIEGEDSDVYFSLFSAGSTGEILSQFTGRKLWQWPPLEGSTALGCSFLDGEAEMVARRLFTSLEWTGLASVEFKRDKRSGRLLITEPTIGRNNHQSAIALAGGCNPTAAMVASYLGIDYQEMPQKRDDICYWFDELFILYRLEFKRNWREALALLAKVLFARKVFVRFRASDLRPFMKFSGWLIKQAFGKFSRKQKSLPAA